MIASDFRGMLGKNVFAAAAGDVPDVFALIRFVRRALDLVGGCRRPCAGGLSITSPPRNTVTLFYLWGLYG